VFDDYNKTYLSDDIIINLIHCNIYSRLKLLLYGDSFSFDIQSSLGIGTIVAIKIPAKKISK